MAFAVASKRAPLAMAGLLQKLLIAAPSASASGTAPSAAALRPACAVAARRLFSTGGAPLDSEQECRGDEGVASDLFRSRGFSVPMPPVIKDIFGESVCMGRLLTMAAGEAAARGCCGCWVSTEDVDVVKLKVAMPGLGKEHAVKVWAEEDDMVMVMLMEAEGVRDPEFDDDYEDPPRYKYGMKFPKDVLKWDQIKTEMKHGVLKVTVPKIRLEEERTDVFKEKIKREDAEDAEESAGLYGTSRKRLHLAPLDSEQECSGDEGVASDLFRSRGFSLPMPQVIKDIFGEKVCVERLLTLAADEAASRGCCGCWVMTEDVDAVKLKVAMPGLWKEHVKVWAEEDDLVMEAEGVRDPEFDDDYEDPPRYRHRIQFPKDTLKMDQIKAEMKHGALKVTVPKIMLEEERTDVFEAKINREDAEERAGLYGTSRKGSARLRPLP